MRPLDPIDELQRARIDGELEDEGARRLAALEAADPEVAARGAGLTELVGRLAGLPEEVAPPRDLLPDIQARLDRAATAPESPAPRRTTLLLAAALVAALALSFLTGRWTGIEPTPETTVVIEAVAPVFADAPAARFAAASDSLATTRLELRRTFEARRGELPPETLALVERNLATIERAMAEIEVAIAANPDDRELGRILLAYQTREISLLEHAQRAAARL